MERIITFFKELLNKELKCQRLGHKVKTELIKIRKRPSRPLGVGVVEDYKAKRNYCARCKSYLSKPYDESYLDYYTSCSMPTSMWDDMREKGYVCVAVLKNEVTA